MLKVLTEEDIQLVNDLYRLINKYDGYYLNNIYSSLNTSKILCATINDNKISSLMIVNIIKNNYYLEEIVFINNNVNEIKDLISFTINYLKQDERGLNIIYDNFPYSELMHQIMNENGFKCNLINYISDLENINYEIISPNIHINDKSEDVRQYIYDKYLKELGEMDEYLEIKSPKFEIDSIHLENTNIAVVRDLNNKVVGTVRFGIIDQSIYLYSLYGEENEIIFQLINLVHNLSPRKMEIGILPVRKSLMNYLEIIGFKILQTDYILKINRE